MKLAFCLFNYFPYGGLQRDFMRIAKECLKRGHAVDVYTMKWEGPQDPLLPVHLIAPKGWQNHARSKRFVAKLQKTLIAQPYDLVVGFNKMPGLDVYYAADTCFQIKAQEKRKAWYRFTPRYRHLLAYEKAVFSPNVTTQVLMIAKAQQAEFMECYATQPERFHLLPPGIARDRIAPDNFLDIRQRARDGLAVKENEFLTLLVGSGFKTKGLDRILIGIAALPAAIKQHTKLFIVGKDKVHHRHFTTE